MKRKKRLLLAAAILLLAALAAAALLKPQSQGVLYRISGGKNTMHILGSIHVGSREMYPFGPDVRNALEGADVLVFECDTQSEDAVRLTEEMIALPQGVQLSALLSEDCAEKLQRVADQMGYDTAALQKLKPWAVVSILSSASALQSMQAESALGVDNMVRKAGGGKTQAWLETTREQLEMLDGMSAELQNYLLETACDEILSQADDGDTASWPAWWRSGDAAAFAQSYRTEMQAEKDAALAAEYHEALMTRRNVRMAQRLAEMLESEETHSYFVTIGLMHLVLQEDSVLTELQRQGYTIEQIANER